MIFSPIPLLLASLCGYALGAAGGLWLMRREKLAAAFSFGVAALSALSGLLAGLLLLAGAPADPDGPFDLLPPLLSNLKFTVRLDALSAFFLVLVSLLGLAVSIYSLGYARGYFGRKNVGRARRFLQRDAAGHDLALRGGQHLVFLIAWELMALTAYCLVSFEHEKPETRQAGVLFFIMSHIGTGLPHPRLSAAVPGLGRLRLRRLPRASARRCPPGNRDAAFLLFLVGFGIKAGVMPLHIWLPAAHPVAPSNVSALMSGGASSRRASTA